MSVHNHPPYRPPCNERRTADGQLRGACLTDDGRPMTADDRGATVPEAHIDLDAIEARASAATEGRWAMWDGYGPTSDGLIGVYRFGPTDGTHVIEDGGGGNALYARREDWEFIACARDDVPALVAEVRRLRAALAEVDVSTPEGRDKVLAALVETGTLSEERAYIWTDPDDGRKVVWDRAPLGSTRPNRRLVTEWTEVKP